MSAVQKTGGIRSQVVNSGKCPKCGAVVEHVKVEAIASKPSPGKPRHEGLTYLCPSCSTFVGVNIARFSWQAEAKDLYAAGLATGWVGGDLADTPLILFPAGRRNVTRDA